MLSELQPSLQSYADVIAKVSFIDVEIVDSAMIRVAGTGIYADMVGESLVQAGEVYKEVMRSRKTVLIQSPRQHAICANCQNRDNCRECFSLATPIADAVALHGVIGMVCFTEADRARIMASLESYTSFISFLAEGLALKIGETTRLGQTTRMLDLMLQAVDVTDLGLILFNRDGSPLYVNAPARELFGEKQSQNLQAEHIQPCGSTVYGYEEYEIKTREGQVYTLPGRMLHLDCGQADAQEGSSVMFVFDLPKRLARLAGDLSSHSAASGFDAIIGRSAALENLKTMAMQIAGSGSTVLITGESGTGKELLARAIHHAGPRKDAPFIAVNCGGIPDTLLESELFGYVSGAFTGASSKGRMGKFELAEGGVIFLDEISAMPLYVQVKLLRVLQERVVIRLGSNRLIHVNVRVIAASNEDLRECISRNVFREDLFYRLNVIPLDMPPLRQRHGDVPILTNYFLDKYCALFHKRRPRLRQSVQHLLEQYSWPGNVRELEHAVEYAVNMMPADGVMGIECLPEKLRDEVRRQSTALPHSAEAMPQEAQAQPVIALAQLEEAAIRHALNVYGNSTAGKKQAAKALGLSLATFYRKIQTFSL